MKPIKILQNLMTICLILIAGILKAQDPQTFVHVTNASNNSTNVSMLDNQLLNSYPNGIYLFTHNYSADGTVGSRHAHKVGWYYSGTKWFLYNENKTKMDTGIGFNVLAPGIGISSWIVTVDTNTNASGNTVAIDHPKINGDTSVKLFVNSVWNLNGDTKGVYNINTLGVYYNIISKKWYVFNQDQTQKMIQGASYNIISIDKSSKLTNYTQLATGVNTASYSLTLNHPLLNNNPKAHVFITAMWNYNKGFFGKYNNHETGVYYNNGRWSIYNEDLVKMDTGVAFNVLIVPNLTTSITSNDMNTAITLFPNPIQKGNILEVNIQNTFLGICDLEIVDLNGKTIISHAFNKTSENWQEQIQLSEMSKGIYIVKMRSNGFLINQKLIVE